MRTCIDKSALTRDLNQFQHLCKTLGSKPQCIAIKGFAFRLGVGMLKFSIHVNSMVCTTLDTYMYLII